MKWIGQHIWDLAAYFRDNVTIDGSLTLDNVGLTAIQTSSESFADNDTSLMTSAAIQDKIQALVTSEDLDVTSDSGTIAIDLDSETLTIAGGNGIDTSATGNSVTVAMSNSVTTDALTFTSANANDPLITIKNTNSDTNSSRLHFVKDKGAAGADGDDIGSVEFISDNSAQTQTSFAKILAEVSESTEGQEAGKLYLNVAASDGSTSELKPGLILEGEHNVDSEVDVTIASGAASTTTIAGTLTIGSTNFVNNSGVIQVATQGTIDHDSLANFVANEHIDWTGSSAGTIHISNISAATAETNGVANFSDDDFTVAEGGRVNLAAVKKTASSQKYAVTGNTDGTFQGDVVYIGGTTSMTTGAIYHYKSDGTWELADADAASTSDGLLAVALGAASNTNGMLLRGMVTLDHDPGAVGDVLFLSTTGGDCSATAPSGTGDIIRIVGYCLDASNGQIWFNPDNTFVEVS